MNTVYIKKLVIDEIYKTMSNDSFEKGGILGMDKKGMITHYCFDSIATQSGKNEYRPSVEWLNLILQQWYQEGICFCGIVHSHPYGYIELSFADKLYAKQIMECNADLYKIYFPILAGYGKDKLVVWEIEKNSNLATRINYIVWDSEEKNLFRNNINGK